MKYIFLKSVLLYMCYSSVKCSFINVYGKIRQENITGDAGQPLILTPLIKQGKIREAQMAAVVQFNGFKSIKSYSGYLTVNEFHNSNLFFWFFPSLTNYTHDPVVLWLQGGPGATSLIGLFIENGPFRVKPRHGLKLRQYSWTHNHNVIYIDNPVGSGYSFTNKDGYAQNETIIGAQLYEALLQFFQLFPELQRNDFFVTGESYGGKYVPAVSYTIHKNNPTAKQKINLRGLAIGNGLSDPQHQLVYSDYLYQIGLIDSNTQAKIKQLEEEAVKDIQNKQWKAAAKLFDDFGNEFRNVTGFKDYYNYLIANNTDESMDLMGKYVQRTDIREAIHVGNVVFNGDSQVVEENLKNDIMQSVAPWVSELLSSYRVLIYNGQVDIIVAYPLTVNYLKNLKFRGDEVYKTAKRHQWHVNGEIAGYIKEAGNLTEVLVRNAGHMVPHDQPAWALDLITRFTRNKPFY